jgi:hypothetical protein
VLARQPRQRQTMIDMIHGPGGLVPGHLRKTTFGASNITSRKPEYPGKTCCIERNFARFRDHLEQRFRAGDITGIRTRAGLGEQRFR